MTTLATLNSQIRQKERLRAEHREKVRAACAAYERVNKMTVLDAGYLDAIKEARRLADEATKLHNAILAAS